MTSSAQSQQKSTRSEEPLEALALAIPVVSTIQISAAPVVTIAPVMTTSVATANQIAIYKDSITQPNFGLELVAGHGCEKIRRPCRRSD